MKDMMVKIMMMIVSCMMMMMMMMLISTDMSSIQKPSSHSKDVSGIMKWMWDELMIFIVS